MGKFKVELNTKVYKKIIEMSNINMQIIDYQLHIRKVAYLRLVNRKEEIQREVESLKPLKSKVIN